MTNIQEIKAKDFSQFSPMIGGDIFKKYLRLAVKDIARKVGATMGASGRTTGLLGYDEQGHPVLNTTKDGANTLRSIKESCLRSAIVLDSEGNEIPSQIYAAAAAAFHSVATQTEKSAGDGTTATTVIAAKFFESAMAEIHSDNLPSFCRQANSEAELIANLVYESAVKDKDIAEEMLLAIATTSLNHDKELGIALGKAIYNAGKYGYCFVQGSKGVQKDVVDKINGYTFGCVNELLFFNKGSKGEYIDPYIIVSKDPIDEISEPKGQKATLKNIIEKYQAENKRTNSVKPLVIFAPSVGGHARSMIEHNYKNFPFVIFVTFTNLRGDHQEQVLEDIATATGAFFFSTEANKNITKIGEFSKETGSASVLHLYKNHFYLETPTPSPNFNTYSDNLSKLIESLDPYTDREERTWLERRYSALVSGVIRVTVSASSDAELNERIDSVQDAQLACFSALRKGIVTGGGITLYNLSDKYKDTPFFAALQAPIKKITSNSQWVLSENRLKELPKEYGLDILTGDYRNFWQESMILDPAESVAEAFKNGVSIAVTLLQMENFNY